MIADNDSGLQWIEEKRRLWVQEIKIGVSEQTIHRADDKEGGEIFNFKELEGDCVDLA